MTEDELKDLAAKAQAWFDQLSPEQQLEHRADQACSWAYHCAKTFRKSGGTYEEFCRLYGDDIKRRYLEKIMALEDK